MEWQLKWGKDEAFLIERAEDGQDVAALDNRPTLTPIQDAAYDAYWLLNPGRPQGFSGPIGLPTIDILALAGVWGLDPEWFLRMIRVMDRVYLDWADAQSKRKAPPQSTAPKPQRASRKR